MMNTGDYQAAIRGGEVSLNIRIEEQRAAILLVQNVQPDLGRPVHRFAGQESPAKGTQLVIGWLKPAGEGDPRGGIQSADASTRSLRRENQGAVADTEQVDYFERRTLPEQVAGGRVQAQDAAEVEGPY